MDDVEVRPADMTPQEQEIQLMALNQLRGADTEGKSLTPYVLNAMRLKADEEGNLSRMTDDEFLGTLGETDQQNFRNYKAQVERQRKALDGTLPISTALQQKKRDEFGQLKEAHGRIGNRILGSSPDTAIADTTAGAQSLNAFKSRYDLAEDTERRNELQYGQSNIAQQRGLLSDLQGKDFSRQTAFPGRNMWALNPYGTQSGLLGDQSILNAQAKSAQNVAYTDFGSNIAGVGTAGLLYKLLKP